jgi:exopolysaccharide biosynthesis polyprenyl glycosylphosphotransferase
MRLIPKGTHWAVPIIMLLDFICMQMALCMGYLLWIYIPWHGNYQLFSEFVPVVWILPIVTVVVFLFIKLYKPEMGVLGVLEQSLIFKGTWIVYFIGFVFSFFYRSVHFSRLAIFYSIFLAIIFISLERYVVRKMLAFLCKKGIGIKRALIYGAGFQGQRLNRWIEQSPQLGIKVQGYLDEKPDDLKKEPVSPCILGNFENFLEVIREHKISIFFIAHQNSLKKDINEIFKMCREHKIQCWAIPSLFKFNIERVKLDNIGGIPLLGIREEFSNSSYVPVKRLIDLIVALILALFLLPLSLFVVIVLKLTSNQPIFFKQIRIGKDGKDFWIYKFRTLKGNVASENAISPELGSGEKKIDPFRKFLRNSGFDEIPQLINILKGEMSLVGPRPEMPFLVAKYGHLEKERLVVSPGVTGLWQVSDDRKRLLIHENMDYDLYYIEHMGFNLDLAILLKTVFVVFKRVFPSFKSVNLTFPS